MAGQINVAQSAFMGVGAYAAARLSENVPFWLAISAGGLAAALVSIVFALPAIRVKGFYLALTTLAAQVMFPIIVLALPSDWLGGTSGMAVEPIEISGRMLSTPLDMYYFTLAGVLICSVGAFNLQRSRFGRALCAVRDNELAAEVTGVNVSYYKVMAFFAGSLFAGVAGGFFACYIRYVTTENLNLLLSIWYLGMLIVGGLSSPLGAILGTAFITAIQEAFHALGGALLTAFPNLGGGLVFATSNVILGICILLALIFNRAALPTAGAFSRPRTASDAVDGSSTGTWVPRIWVLLMRPRFEGGKSCKRLRQLVSTSRSRFFRFMASMRRAMSPCVVGSSGATCWPSSRNCGRAWLVSKPAPHRITGRANSKRLVTLFA